MLGTGKSGKIMPYPRSGMGSSEVFVYTRELRVWNAGLKPDAYMSWEHDSNQKSESPSEFSTGWSKVI